jgi:hypothetical protein
MPARVASRTLLALTVVVLSACARVGDTDVTVGDWRAWVEERARTQAEARSIMIDCYREQGWEVREDVPGTPGLFEVPIPEGQWDAFQSAKSQCEQDLEERGYGDRAFEPQDIANFYGYMVDRYECLIATGLDVPSPPSLEVYLETYSDTVREDHWDPYGHIPHHLVLEATAACPQNL